MDRALIARVLKHMRGLGWSPDFYGWSDASRDTFVEVYECHVGYEVIVRHRPGGKGVLCQRGSATVRDASEAVDALCALRVLPAELSSMWRQGRESVGISAAIDNAVERVYRRDRDGAYVGRKCPDCAQTQGHSEFCAGFERNDPANRSSVVVRDRDDDGSGYSRYDLAPEEPKPFTGEGIPLGTRGKA